MTRRILFILSAVLGSQFSLGQAPLSQQATERLYKSGLDLMTHNDYGAAREDFAQYLALTSANDLKRVDAQYYEAFCALNLYHADGEKKIEDFIADHPHHPKAASAYLDLANSFYTERNYGRAANYFSKVDFTALTREQHNAGRFHWGYSLFNLRKLKDALDQFNYIKTLGGQFGPASSYYAGFIEYDQMDYENSLTDLKRAEQSKSYELIVPHLIASVYYKQKKYDLLLSYITSVQSKSGLANPEELALLLAEASYKKGDYVTALNGYQKYLDENPSHVEAGVLFRAGFAAYSLKKDDEAIEYLKQSASDKDSVGFYSSYYLGSVYLKKGQKPLALTAFDNARKFKADPRLVEEATFQFAKIAYEVGQPDRAIDEFERFMQTFPQSPHVTEVKELLSQAYVNANNYNKAIEYIEGLPRRGPAIDRAYQKATLLKGMELFNMADYAHAVVYFEKSQTKSVSDEYLAEASFWCGEAYSVGLKYEQAVEQYLHVIGLANLGNASLLTKTRYGLGYAFFNLQQYERALLNFKLFVSNANESDANFGDGLIRLGDCYYVTKSYSDALATYRRVLQINSPDLDYVHLQLGVVLGIQRKYPDATAELDQVIQNFPDSRFVDEALFQRAQLDFEQGKYSAAIVGFTRLIDTNKTSRFLPYAYMRRATCYYNLKDYDKTAADYVAVIEKYPSHPVANDALLPLQEALNLSGRGAEFDNFLTQFKVANPEAKGIEGVEFESAKNVYFSQQYDKAIQSLGNFIATYPESSNVIEAKFYRAESYYRLKEYNEALSIYNDISSEASFAFANRVVSRIAEVEFKLGKYQAAIKGFHVLEHDATTKKEQFNAWSGLMESHYLLTNYDSVDYYAHIILEKGNVNAGAQNMASLYLGKSAMARGDYESAKDEFLNALNTARDQYGAEAKYLLGEIFYLTKDYKQCYETLIGLNADFAAYNEWVGKSFLLLADNYVAMGDLFQAKGTLKSLIENFPLQDIRSLASQKLKEIEASEIKEQNQSDSTKNENE